MRTTTRDNYNYKQKLRNIYMPKIRERVEVDEENKYEIRKKQRIK